MDRKRYVGWIGAGLVCASMVVSCTSAGQRQSLLHTADSLNQVSYALRYKDLPRAARAAGQAYEYSAASPSVRAEALNNMAFCAFMRMDFEQAIRLYRKALSASNNEVESLIADIGLMKVCQRTSMNKEFYDYRNSALRRIRRIREDQISLENDAVRKRMDYALSEFYIVSGIYYYYLQQEDESLASIEAVSPDWIKADSAQWLYYLYMKGSGGMYRGATAAEITKGEFSCLVECLQASHAQGYIYFEANALQAMAELLLFRSNRELLSRELEGLMRLVNPNDVPLDSLPLRFAREALRLFKRYGDWYQISGTYRTMASYYNSMGEPEKALRNLAEALGYVNRHHEKYYHCEDTLDRLFTFVPGQERSTELTWINDEGIKTVPEWIARLREQLSRTYAAMDRKVESDFNRNIYLDILDYTRQDKELESRYGMLESESSQLNGLLLLVGISFILLVLVFVFLNRYWRTRNTQYVNELKRVLEVCRKITSSVPPQASGMEEIKEAVCRTVQEDLLAIFRSGELWIEVAGDDTEARPDWTKSEQVVNYALVSPGKQDPVGTLWLHPLTPLRKEEKVLVRLLVPYLAWTLENGQNLVSLDDERRRVEKEQYVHEKHLVENKCENEVKKTCLALVTGILPYIDRVVNEVNKLRTLPSAHYSLKAGKLQYIDELITRINEYNDILALWIKMRQGTVSLNIEGFELNELFQTLAKGRRSFELKRQTFVVPQTTAVVKADKALTLFMINTLAENARKYTPAGGRIELSAEETETYVEIAVTDNGPGLSETDVNRILGEKVYDSKQIGMDTAIDTQSLQKQKGNGFGLMNCKGIIEKYRKTNALFQVCTFRIESAPGKGSRFFFRLPKGLRRLGIWMGILVCGMQMGGCSQHASTSRMADSGQDTLPVPSAVASYDSLLAIANDYANRVYDNNVNGDYTTALTLADSVLYYMNKHYQQYADSEGPLARLYGAGQAAELTWLANGFDTDYYILLDVRNEAAVASLAVKDFRRYRYNNAAYTTLYKLLSEDNSLDYYCKQMQQSANNKLIALAIFLLLVLGGIVAYYLLYIRKQLRYRYNMEQVFAVNNALFLASAEAEKEPVSSIPHILVNGVFNELNELIPLTNLALMVYNEEWKAFETAYYQEVTDEELEERMKRAFEKEQVFWSTDAGWCFLPLWNEAGGEKHCIGLLALQTSRPYNQEEDQLLVQLMSGYLGSVLYHTLVTVQGKFHDIELAQDDARRTSFEENQLHVQNMVLDNCLSTIKHETIYYPNRIKQIVDRLTQENLAGREEQEQLEAMSELVEYYKEVFTLLTSCASRQLEGITFRRSDVSVEELSAQALRYLQRMNRKQSFRLTLEVEAEPLWVSGDKVLLAFLLENLLDEAMRFPREGKLILKIYRTEAFVRFDFIDSRRNFTRSELNELFYPDKNRMQQGSPGGGLTGTEYLVCKQIIRDHDEFAGLRGCRINAESVPDGQGFMVWFTIPYRVIK